ncbi:MAG: phosphatase PAP2 family protein [Fidelibacterota bacterium]
MRVVITYFLLISTVFSFLAADESETYLGYFSRGLKQTVADGTNQIILSTALLGGVLLRGQDVPLRNRVQPEGFMSDQLSLVLDKYGNGWAYSSALVGVGVLSYHQGGRDQLARDIRYLTTTLGTTGAVTSLLKWAVGRERPNGSDHKSFPSGHTSASFALAAALDELYGQPVGWLTYLIATAVGAQRIHGDKHWLTDVIAGAALGTVIGRGFAVEHQRDKKGVAKATTLYRPDYGFAILLVVPIK